MSRVRLMALAGMAVVGCSLLVDTDPLVSGEADAGADASASEDASADTTTPDALLKDSGQDVAPDVPGDAVIDTGNDVSDVVDAGGPFCAALTPAPTLCSDFDQQNLPAGWTEAFQWGGANPVIDSAQSTSAPRSLLFTTPTLAAGAQCGTGLAGSFAKPVTSIRVEMDLFPAAIFDEAIQIIVIKMTGATGTVTSTLRMSDSMFDVRESVDLKDGGADYASHLVAKTPKLSAWQHVAWQIDFGGSAAFSNVDVDGSVSGGGLEAKAYLGPAYVDVGIPFAMGPSAPIAIRVDNVVVDVK